MRILPLTLLLGCSSKVKDHTGLLESVSDSAGLDSQIGTTESAESGSESGQVSETGETGEIEGPSAFPLELTYLGVGGVALRHGDDLILTAPLLTNPSMETVTLGETVSDPALVASLLPAEEVEGAAAILVGHAHYDHLLDVPTAAEMAGDPVIYGNVSARNLLAGVLDVTAINDPSNPLVDRRMCGTPDPCTGVPAGYEGDWIQVPGANVRIRALCSMHPDQFLGIVHYAEGCVDEPQASPPTYAGDWLEGATVSWLIDFLDDDGNIAWRVYYQDAPTDAPIGDVYPDLLAERPVDLALLCVGSYDYVRDAPAEALANMDPRYVVGIHWENFFQTQDLPIEPIPLQPDPGDFDDRAADALGADDEDPVLVEGVAQEGRYWRPDPQTHFELPLRAEGPGPVASEPTDIDASTEMSGDRLVLHASLPAYQADCAALGDPTVPCDDEDADGLTDAWEDLVLQRLHPTIRFDEAEPFFWDDDVLFDVGRVAPSEDGSAIRVFIMQGYGEDYGRCGLSFHDGDSERVAMDLSPLGGGDVEVVGLYTAAHEGTIEDHSTLWTGDDVAGMVTVDEDDGPRWRVFASDGKHATYPTVDLCEDAEWIPCLEEDCDADGVDDPAGYDILPPIINVGEEDAPRYSGLEQIGFPDEDAWLDQDFCGGQGRGTSCSAPARDKLMDDPF